MQSGGTTGGVDELYQDLLLEHYKSPRNHQLLENPDLSSEGFNPFCGDRVMLTARLDQEGHIREVGFTGQGCAISQASASIMTEIVKGETLEEARATVVRVKAVMQGKALMAEERDTLKDLVILEGVKRFPIRVKCALLAWSALQDAIVEHQRRRSNNASSS